MSAKPQSHRRKVRTFAEDMEAAKKAGDSSAATKKQPEHKKEKTTPKPEKRKPAKKAVKPVKSTKEKKSEPADIPTPKDSLRPLPARAPAFQEPQKQSGSAAVGYDSTIITDTKNRKFSLVEGIGDGIKKWFKQRADKKKRKKPIYTVPSAHRRKGVIEEATSKTGAVFTARNETLRKQIQMRRARATQPAPEPTEEPETFWSPYTESGRSLLEAPEPELTRPHNITVEVKRRRRPRPIPPYHASQSVASQTTTEKQGKTANTSIETTPPPTAIKTDGAASPIPLNTNQAPVSAEVTPPATQPEPISKTHQTEPVKPTTPEKVTSFTAPLTKNTRDDFSKETAAESTAPKLPVPVVTEKSDHPEKTNFTQPTPPEPTPEPPVSSEPETTASIKEEPKQFSIPTPKKTPPPQAVAPEEVRDDYPDPEPEQSRSYEEPILPSNKRDYEKPTTLHRFRRIDTNTLTFSILFLISITVLVGYASYLLVQQMNDADREPGVVRSFATEPVLQGTQIKNVILSADMISSINQQLRTTAATGSSQAAELPIISPAGEEIGPAYLFQIMGFNTLPALSFSIQKHRFVSINNQPPALVMEYIDHSTVLGSLLSWEPTMANDLTKLYNLPPVETPEFTDEIVANTSARVLESNNRPLLVYGFVKDRYLIIAPSIELYTQVVQLIPTE